MRSPSGTDKVVSVGQVCLTPATPAHTDLILSEVEREHAQNLSFFSGPPITRTQQLDYLRRMEQSENDWLFLIRTSDTLEVIGTAGLHEIDRVNKNARLGMLIFHESDRGKGYGSETIRALHEVAFRVLHLHKVYVRTLWGNERAFRKYIEQFGYLLEGTLREEYLLRGEYHDMRVLSLLESEWSRSD